MLHAYSEPCADSQLDAGRGEQRVRWVIAVDPRIVEDAISIVSAFLQAAS